ncbi:MAG: hypothetical protein ACRDCA_28590 [Serratia sp. (in: enterobacteria)]|uniref:hypothetical protein n=1 Tax=Serratia sp. (in: enterobacteria) TaxID=616 RepID=UPI003F3F9792
MKKFTEKQLGEIKELSDEFEISMDIATHAYLEMIENFELTEEEAISSYWLEKGEEPPAKFGGREQKKRASVEEVLAKRDEKRKAQEIKRGRDSFKSQLDIEIEEALKALGHEIVTDGKKKFVLDEHGYKYEFKTIATRK